MWHRRFGDTCSLHLQSSWNYIQVDTEVILGGGGWREFGPISIPSPITLVSTGHILATHLTNTMDPLPAIFTCRKAVCHLNITVLWTIRYTGTVHRLYFTGRFRLTVFFLVWPQHYVIQQSQDRPLKQRQQATCSLCNFIIKPVGAGRLISNTMNSINCRVWLREKYTDPLNERSAPYLNLFGINAIAEVVEIRVISNKKHDCTRFIP